MVKSGKGGGSTVGGPKAAAKAAETAPKNSSKSSTKNSGKESSKKQQGLWLRWASGVQLELDPGPPECLGTKRRTGATSRTSRTTPGEGATFPDRDSEARGGRRRRGREILGVSFGSPTGLCSRQGRGSADRLWPPRPQTWVHRRDVGLRWSEDLHQERPDLFNCHFERLRFSWSSEGLCASHALLLPREAPLVCASLMRPETVLTMAFLFLLLFSGALVLGEQFVRKPKRSQAMLRVGVSASSQSRLRTGSHKSRQQQPECLEARLRRNCHPMEAHARVVEVLSNGQVFRLA